MHVSIKEVGINKDGTSNNSNVSATQSQCVDNASQSANGGNDNGGNSNVAKDSQVKLSGAQIGARRALNLSIIGLILSVFCGIGLVFSIIGTVLSAVYKKDDALSCKYSMAMGISGIVLSVAFIVLTVVCLFLLLI